jgi:apolipoprotein a
MDFDENLDCQTLTLPEPGSDYIGTVSQTATGIKCQNWRDQYPHRHEFSDYGNNNYCRNQDFGPLDAPEGIWCYTTDSDIRWGYCTQVI